jgi:uncharacterized protein (DUF1015 family)
VQTLSPGRPPGLVVAPFRGVRYIPHRASGIADVTSPPYDVIGATALDELLTADPHNVVRLILPGRAPGDGEAGEEAPGTAQPAVDRPGEAYQRAARRLHGWLGAGILAADPEPSLYVYEQRSCGQGTREQGTREQGTREQGDADWVQRGLIALVGVGDPRSSGILPHEDVMPGPVRDRADLMAATRANLEPIFLVYGGRATRDAAPGSSDAGGEAADDGAPGAPAASGARSATTELVDLVADSLPPLVTAVTKDGIAHRLWRLTDPGRQAAVAADLAARPALIADGHHRYAAYREVRDFMHAAGHGGGPWDFGLAFIVDADAYPPRLGAIHRVIPALGLAEAARLATGAFRVQALGVATLEAAIGCLARAGRDAPAFLLAGAAGFMLVTSPDPVRLEAVMPAAASPAWRRLDAAILQRFLLADAWGIEDNDRDVPVFHDAAEAVSAAADTGGTAVISNPVPFAAVSEIAWHGERVPRKSTSFGPKPRSGLVLRTFDA